MKKNLIIILTIFVLSISLVACGNDAKATTGQSQTQTEINTTEAVEVVETTEEALGKGDAPVVEETTAAPADSSNPVYTGWFAEKIKDPDIFSDYGENYCWKKEVTEKYTIYRLEYKDIIVQNCTVNPDDYIWDEAGVKVYIDLEKYLNNFNISGYWDDGLFYISANDISILLKSDINFIIYSFDNSSYIYEKANQGQPENTRYIGIRDHERGEPICVVCERDFYALETAIRSMLDGKKECPWVLKKAFE